MSLFGPQSVALGSAQVSHQSMDRALRAQKVSHLIEAACARQQNIQHSSHEIPYPLHHCRVRVVRTCSRPRDEASHRKATEALLELMDMESLLTQSVDQMLQVQVQQNPSIAPYQQQDMKAFFAKYMSWASLKDDMVTIYMAEFTELELKALTAFYQTPVGKKTLQRMPALIAKGAEMGQRRVQEHLPELQAAIAAKAGSAAPANKAP